jgi:hypothetical protein
VEFLDNPQSGNSVIRHIPDSVSFFEVPAGIYLNAIRELPLRFAQIDIKNRSWLTGSDQPGIPDTNKKI